MALTNIDGKLVEDLSGFYPMGYGLYGAMGRSEGIMPSESSSYTEGEDGDENSVEGEGEESGLGIEAAELPRFRQLVREKKLKLKAQYGKAYVEVTSQWNVFGIKGPGVGEKTSWQNLVLWPNKTKLVHGWRKQWKNFKSSGGLSQLKLQSKGLTPIPTTTTPPTTITPTENVPTTTVPSFSNINIKPIKKAVVIKGTLPTKTTAIEEEEEVVAKLGDKKPVMKIAVIVLIFVIIAIGAYMILRKK
ncbi:MAG: hypothetical protein EXR20_07110 [Bacteroidetes bacterium]|jgi:hypothetical protein|nr:hypothetical protein [Bacteroidota bacterium]